MRNITLNKKIFLFGLIVLFSTTLFSQQNTVIQVLSAVVKDEVIPNAEVIFQKNGQTSVKAYTNNQGKLIISSPFGGIDDPSVTIIIKKEGYSTLVTKGPCNGLTYALSPTMKSLDGIRVVLNWNGNPQDIDSHLSYPGNHICYYHKTGSMGNLDVDDVDGYGPETVTIEKKAQGQKYVYAVHDFTDKDNAGNTNLSGISGAKVYVYIGNTLIKTYSVPSGYKEGNVWIVFMIDESGNFVDINKFSNASTWEAVGTELEEYRGEENTSGEAIISQQDIQESVSFNRQGEDAYHAGNLETSIEYYQKAIELDPNNGQAYSNLGLSFQKLGREAEAIWANRKAIALAHGPQINTIKASSFYNIAKIYENKGQLEDALQNYTWARQQKQNTVYDNAIKRVNEKLGR